MCPLGIGRRLMMQPGSLGSVRRPAQDGFRALFWALHAVCPDEGLPSSAAPGPLSDPVGDAPVVVHRARVGLVHCRREADVPDVLLLSGVVFREYLKALLAGAAQAVDHLGRCLAPPAAQRLKVGRGPAVGVLQRFLKAGGPVGLLRENPGVPVRLFQLVLQARRLLVVDVLVVQVQAGRLHRVVVVFTQRLPVGGEPAGGSQDDECPGLGASDPSQPLVELLPRRGEVHLHAVIQVLHVSCRADLLCETRML